MGIFIKNNIFVLETEHTHYAFGIDDEGCNRHIHWGKKCDVDDYFIEKIGDESSHNPKLDEYRQEYTVFGGTMYRQNALKATYSDGCREVALEYKGYERTENTLSIKLVDVAYHLAVTLHYEIHDDSDIITRWTTVTNLGDDIITLENIASAELSLPSYKPYAFKNTNGCWAGEFVETESVLEGGSLVWQSRGGISGHNNSPYFIAHQNADENNGDVYFASLAYSGNFKVTANRDLYGITRVILGVSDFDFSFNLNSGESFETPKVYCGVSKGLGSMTRQMNRFAIDHILPKPFNDKILPVLYNSWEATYFNVNSTNQSMLARRAASLGVELFVMDDGWFGSRYSDRAGLGDWYVNKLKFPRGLKPLIKNVNKLGMDFGIWVEPEMVNRKSKLFKEHPDWVYHYDKREAHELRNQLVLNMTRQDVQNYLFEMLDTLLTENNIKYIKWDMNRALSETGAENLDNPQELWYRHTMAVYNLVDRLKAKHPDVQFESCCSGGGRSDLGALSHFDEAWPSDNTDGIDRMTIQKGYSLLRPTKTMRAWVTDVTGILKDCSLKFRFNIAMQGVLSLGGNLSLYGPKSLAICKKNIALYKEIRHIVQFGDLYRVLDIEKDEVLLNHYVSRDKSESVAFLAANGTRFYKKRIPIRFEGLAPDKRYRLTFDGKDYEKSGAYLSEVGLPVHIRGNDFSEVIKVKAVD